MRRILLGAMVLMMTAAGGLVAAQTPAPSAEDHAAHHPAPAASKPAQTSPNAVTPAPKAGATAGQSPMGGGMMGGGMMGGGMCPMMGGAGMQGGMMGGGMGPMMGGATTKVDVKKVDKGVTITMTSPDAATAARLQKMAEAMRLMHEAMAQ
jgi:hypothetical protein